MDARFRRVSIRPRTIRTLVVSWVGSVLLAWAILVAGLFAAKSQLSKIADQVVMDVRVLSAARELESVILAQRREDLLWEVTDHTEHRKRSSERLQTAERIAASLASYVTTEKGQELLMQIQREMRVSRREESTPVTVASVEAEAQSVDDLLAVVDRFQLQNETQMEDSIRAADHLREKVSGWALGLSIGTAVLLLAGALSLLRRVMRPALALTNATQAFGRGDFSARTPILHDDELGALAHTFNNMASDIAEREKNRLQFVAMVVHDLKNPVLAIEMAARMLRESQRGEPERRLCLSSITEEIRRLRQIVRDLMDDTQIASGHFSLHKTDVDLSSLVRRLIETQAKVLATHRIDLKIDEACIVHGDMDRIERVVMNLVSNAVKYSPPNTCVTLRVEKRDSQVALTISDQGPGIAQEDLQVIFQPFGRGRSAHTLAEGAGLGLYAVKQIVEAHGGCVEVQSQPGRGTTFQIRLPLAQAVCAG